MSPAANSAIEKERIMSTEQKLEEKLWKALSSDRTVMLAWTVWRLATRGP